MKVTDQNPTRFTEREAQCIVQEINRQVGRRICSSTVIDQKWSKMDDNVCLFDRKELELGELVGTGGFCSVYEVSRFVPRRGGCRKYSENQRETRNFFRDNATEGGDSKYVVKHVKRTLATMGGTAQFCMAAADLVVEAAYLRSLKHENIIKIHGWSSLGSNAYASGDLDGHFLILDRIHETLERRIMSWKVGNCDLITWGISRIYSGGSNSIRCQLSRRTAIARQIAEAIHYLHTRNIVFRDLKPSNVGFDKSGTVKLFDFGLARELPSEPTSNGSDLYKMSGNLGSLPYIAPEVSLCKEYNQKVDTYAWSLVYWSMLTLEIPYRDMSRAVHTLRVCKLGKRPSIRCIHNEKIRNLLEMSWSQSVENRLTMAEVCFQLDLLSKSLDAETHETKERLSAKRRILSHRHLHREQ